MRPIVQATGLLCFCVSAQAIIPLPVQDLAATSIDATTLGLSWSPVTMDTNGQPLIGVSYDAHVSPMAYFTPSAATRIANTSATFLESSVTGEPSFYQVVVRGHAVPQPNLVTVPAGSFDMGQVNVAMPNHPVAMTHTMVIGRREVTNQEYYEAAQWALDLGLVSVIDGDLVAYGQSLLMMSDSACEIGVVDGELALHASVDALGAYPNGYSPANHPVKMVTWFGAAMYCDWISMMSGLQPYYQGQFDQVPGGRDPYQATGFRLPTEAEWEYAAQYNNERTYAWGNQYPNCTRVVYASCANWSAPVGSKPGGANALGMLDLNGNVFEWCNDWSAVYDGEAATDPTGPDLSDHRIVRGGGWDSISGQLSLAQRYHSLPLDYYISLGFRVCRIVD